MSDQTRLGSCCTCGEENDTVRNIMMLDKMAPIPGKGWGCYQCYLPLDGALAVLCDSCLEKVQKGEAEIKMAVSGYPAENVRVDINTLRDIDEAGFHHDPALHPEMLEESDGVEFDGEWDEEFDPEWDD
jgi:hypothetical protein